MLKPSFEALDSFRESSILVRYFEEEEFSAPYHFHPEYELTLILKGEGTRYVGSHMDTYTAGDLVLLGPNLPHCWKTAGARSGEANAVSVVVQFREDCLGASFFYKPEFKAIAALMQRSNLGVRFDTGRMPQVAERLKILPGENDPLKRLLIIFDVLHSLANTADYRLLENRRYMAGLSETDRGRHNAVMAYIVDNFRDKISLQKAAETASMTPPAFCKYFRRMNGKTLTDVVTDYRMDYALRLVVQTDKTIAEIGFESGFCDLSNFFKAFKKRLNCSPLAYRKDFLKEMS